MKQKLSMGLLVTIIIVISVIAIFFYNRTLQTPLFQERPLTTVTVAPVRTTTIRQNIESLGTARADEAVTITANATEHVKRIYFDDGEHVEKGTLLLQLEDAEEQALLQEALAQAQEAKRQYQRSLQLARQDYLSAAEHDIREANLKSTEATVGTIQARIADRYIRAPFSGVLGFREVSAGALVEPGDSIVTLDKIDKIKVDFSLPEKYLSVVKRGQEVAISADAFPQQTFHGNISAINTRIHPDSRAFTMRVILDNADTKLKPGMLLHIALKGPPEQLIAIPEQAIVPENDEQYVYILNKDQTVSLRQVTLGQRLPGKVVIKSGLKPNEIIVIDGGFKLQPGQKVQVVKGNHNQLN